MKRDRTPEAVLSELLSLIPQRQVTRDKSASPTDYNTKQNTDQSLSDMAQEESGKYFRNANQDPRFYFITHIERDGILAARSLQKAMEKTARQDQVVYSPKVNEKQLPTHVNGRRLRQEAVACGYAQKKKIPVWQTVVSVFAGLGAVVSTSSSILDLVGKLDNNALPTPATGALNQWLPFVMILFFVACVCSLIVQHRKNNREMTAALTQKLNEISDDDFIQFLSKFSDSDWSIPDCDKLKSDAPILICALQTYNTRQKAILRAYWASLTKKQLWFVFMEDTPGNQALIPEASKERERRLYTLKPLSKHEKRRIAKKIYSDQNKIRFNEDTGIRGRGVDHICRFKLREVEPEIDAGKLQDQIREFCKEYQPCYHVDINLVIRLVAELSSIFYIDFSNRRSWEHLFDFHNEDAATKELDAQITALLQLDNTTIKNLIPEIQHRFGDHLKEIAESYRSTEQTSEYRQWCLLKALRSRADNQTDRHLAIADVLMNEWQYGNDEGSPIWAELLIKTLQVFHKAHLNWFLPAVIHNLLRIGSVQNESLPKRLFSRPIVMDVARDNLLLNINTVGNEDMGPQVDLVRDHYRVVTLAAMERNSQFDANVNRDFPSCFQFLRLTNQERQRYYNTLVFLDEEAVLEYYSYIFDMYCASLLLANRNIRFCYKELYDNTLYEKYAKKSRIPSPSPETYIQLILLRLLGLLHRLYSAESMQIGESIHKLTGLLDDKIPGDKTQQILFLLTKFDIIGADTLNFIGCMIARLDSSNQLPSDAYLGLGNYLIGITFLMYHENTQDSFYNHDFVHLIRMIIDYTDPCQATLGYLFYCDTMFKSNFSGKIITRYISAYKSQFLENLQAVASEIKLVDVEAFITFVLCIAGVNAMEKRAVYATARQTILAKYPTEPTCPALVEVLTLSIENRSSEPFLHDTPENNLTKILALSGDSVYIVYDHYLNTYGAQYLELCPMVAEKILSSFIEQRVDPITKYALEAENKESEAYIQTVQKLFQALNTSNLNFGINRLERFMLFLQIIILWHDRGDRGFQWLNTAKAEDLTTKINVRRSELLVIQSKEYLSPRVWNKYGIIFFLRYLMSVSTFVPHASDKNYQAFTSEQKHAYFISNCKTLEPILKMEDKIYYNIAYMDMLNAFINNGEIQKQLDAFEILLKLANDALRVIDHLAVVESAAKAEMRKLVKDYISMISRL